ncbi:uncharacterized protein TRIADDRAFT_58794 [Trichoplax adhaerens]|uniref:Amino acid transporter transmembrane domain-containing protein n=1 Tax=Trichoplax adhaerens TaxID=10228 RepID=B3S3P2_TRIAD|nr:predicted protein [Trichoplax adhaerens]EDV22313.1 predicted protein [Trichoplax adhaerens]|eukprot:XP_002114857.1 predicted protein [Trichoplax adhaerens]
MANPSAFCGEYFKYFIVSLPSVVDLSGLPPLIVSFCLNIVLQSSIIYAYTTLMQQARIIIFSSLDTNHLQDSDKEDENSPILAPISFEEIDKKNQANKVLVTSSAIGGIFLPIFGQIIFNLFVILLFMPPMISAALGGSQSFAALIGVNYNYIIGPYVWIFAILSMIAHRVLHYSIPIMAGLKYVLLLTIYQFIDSCFKFYLNAGGFEIMAPTMFASINLKKREIILFLVAIISAIITIAFIQALWTAAVLRIVPQTCQDIPYSWHDQFGIVNDTDSPIRAKRHGVLSIIPMMKIIKSRYPEYNWIASFSAGTLFYMMSINFICNALVLANNITGVITFMQKLFNRKRLEDASRKVDIVSTDLYTMIGYFLVIAIIFLIAFFNSKAFIVVLAYGATSGNNIIGGIVLPIMFVRSHFSQARHLEIPLPLHPIGYILFAIAAIYLNVQLVYAIIKLAS